jgi:hypothetical protein
MEKEFKQNESYMHLFAKKLLVEKLKEIDCKNHFCNFLDLSWRSNYGVFSELPFHVSDDPYYFELSAGIKDDETNEFDPDFDRGRILFVPDICIFHKGTPKYFIEIVHTHETPQFKLDRISLFFKEHSIELYEVSAYEVLSSVNDITNINLKKII